MPEAIKRRLTHVGGVERSSASCTLVNTLLTETDKGGGASAKAEPSTSRSGGRGKGRADLVRVVLVVFTRTGRLGALFAQDL